MKLAVLMATYNGEKYLEEQINSILTQKTVINFELIVRDDNSNDKTEAILKSYSKKGLLRYYSGQNVGAARGFISLLRDNPGYDFYAFSDQDDIWKEDKLQNGIDALTGIRGPSLYCTNCELVDSNMNRIGRNTHREIPTYSLESILCLASCAQGCTSVFNSELAKIIQVNPVPEVFIMHDSLITCLCSLLDGNIIYNNEPSMLYRMHEKNVFGMVSAKQSLKHVLVDRYREITTKPPINMYDQAQSILKIYEKYICERNKKICNVVINSKWSYMDRLKLVLCPKLKHDTLNKTITKKLEIFLGND